MLLLKPDPTFYPAAKLAMQAPAEGLAYECAYPEPVAGDQCRGLARL
jgi:hypothetical protein